VFRDLAGNRWDLLGPPESTVDGHDAAAAER
jgi:hypothetical protein